MVVSFPMYVNQMGKNIAIGVDSSRVVCTLYCVRVVRITNIMRELVASSFILLQL
jgi:hypothetical protein